MNGELVESFEMRHPDRWMPDCWVCQMGEDCCSLPAQWLGWSIGDGNEPSASNTPFIVVFEEGTTMMVCEDCCCAFEEGRRDVEQARYEREMGY